MHDTVPKNNVSTFVCYGKTPKFPNFEKKGAQPFRVKCKLDSASYSTGYHYMAAKSSKCILCGGRTSCDLPLLSDFFRLQFAIVIGLISFSKYITQFEIRHVIDKCWWWRSLTFERKRLKLVLICKLTKNVWQKLCHDVPCMFSRLLIKISQRTSMERFIIS